MWKKLVASGGVLFIIGVLILMIPEQNRIHIELLPFSAFGILVGIIGIVLAVIGLGTILARRLQTHV